MSVLSDLVRERNEWASSHVVPRRMHGALLKVEWMLLAVLWMAAFVFVLGGVPEPVQVLVGAMVDYVRGIAATVVGLSS